MNFTFLDNNFFAPLRTFSSKPSTSIFKNILSIFLLMKISSSVLTLIGYLSMYKFFEFKIKFFIFEKGVFITF
jgi:uncharacterized membrane protein